ncbi:MAG: hypothetical protein RR049_05930, partial [Angelakisella sp.]
IATTSITPRFGGITISVDTDGTFIYSNTIALEVILASGGTFEWQEYNGTAWTATAAQSKITPEVGKKYRLYVNIYIHNTLNKEQFI